MQNKIGKRLNYTVNHDRFGMPYGPILFNFNYFYIFIFISTSLPPLSLSCPPQLFVLVDSSVSISKVMWNVTNNPPAAFPLKSILCQKHKMSIGKFSPLLPDLEACPQIITGLWTVKKVNKVLMCTSKWLLIFSGMW